MSDHLSFMSDQLAKCGDTCPLSQQSYNPLCLRVKNLDNRLNYVNDQLEYILETCHSTQA